MSEEKPRPEGKPERCDPPHVTSAIGTSMWKPRLPYEWDDDGTNVASSYNPFDALKKVPRFHD
jgi:hypothetical protein